MEWRRIAELHAGAPGGLRGSGYLLGPGLALTARHVVEGLETTQLRLLEADEDGLPGAIGPWQQARVVWTGKGLDLALLAPSVDAPPFKASGRRMQIGRIDGRAPVRVDAMGFPRAMLAPTHSDTLHLEAHVNAWSGLRSDALLLDVGSTRPAEPEGWKGMSGAAVFAGDCLIGVIEAVPAQLDDSTLRAVPVFTLLDDDGPVGPLDEAKVERAVQFVDAAYVEKLPRAGYWGGVQEQYARAVVATLCRIDTVGGLAVAGVPDCTMSALAAFTGRRLSPWPEEAGTKSR